MSTCFNKQLFVGNMHLTRRVCRDDQDVVSRESNKWLPVSQGVMHGVMSEQK